ncbi:UNVERIFIED_CONTAM: hypothetical protein Sradi_0703800 [Sesamum radiatum]|uniref:Uncharacterized protein n=1 Tax=Sesamum radiatum TaxID=300843 RepID=A0AAW2VN92_SESRA
MAESWLEPWEWESRWCVISSLFNSLFLCTQPGRGRRAGSAPKNKERGRAGQQTRDQLEEEVESRPSLPEDELPPPLHREAPPEEERSQRRGWAATGQASIGGTDNICAFPLAVVPPRRNPFAAHILAEAIQPGIKIPNISEYDGTRSPGSSGPLSS